MLGVSGHGESLELPAYSRYNPISHDVGSRPVIGPPVSVLAPLSLSVSRQFINDQFEPEHHTEQYEQTGHPSFLVSERCGAG